MKRLIVFASIFLIFSCSVKDTRKVISEYPEYPEYPEFLALKKHKRYYSKGMVVKEKIYAKSWSEIQEKNLVVICGNYVIEFAGKVAMYPDLIDKDKQYRVGTPQYRSLEEEYYQRSAYFWKLQGETLYLEPIGDNGFAGLEFKIVSFSGYVIYIQSKNRSEAEECILQRH